MTLKHKMTICSKFGGHGPFGPLATPMIYRIPILFLQVFWEQH